ncbi:LysR family transcriptional regulator [Thalassotalea sp. G2M2-11]|uniref:LysR family transcriptional regulator n=1 Tax=Thalassotalea sp. G2M2-11 TaxID=2787627 RepID=UPI0019D2D012|nr:LysR family transcriptional regulator [Thalassotalea sp. G2M2-11]
MNPYEDMQTFIRIVEAGSITKAAEQMNTVKSAISRRLTELEKRLGVSLITRTTRSQTLTASGQSYYQQCLRLTDDLLEIEANIRSEHRALSGRIKIAAPLTFGIRHLSQALRTFNDIHPDVSFDIDFNDRKVDLIQEGFDMAIRIAKLQDSSLIAKPLFQSQAILCASPSYLKQYGTPEKPEDLLTGHVRVHYTGGKNTWSFLSSTGKQMTCELPSVINANNGDFLCQSAIDGKGLLYSPDFICYKALRQKQLIPLLRDYWCNNTIDGYAIYPQTRHLSQRVRSLVDYLSQYFGKSPYWSLE